MAWRSQTFGPTYLYYLNRMSALSENQWGLGGKGNPGLPEERDPRIEAWGRVRCGIRSGRRMYTYGH